MESYSLVQNKRGDIRLNWGGDFKHFENIVKWGQNKRGKANGKVDQQWGQYDKSYVQALSKTKTRTNYKIKETKLGLLGCSLTLMS